MAREAKTAFRMAIRNDGREPPGPKQPQLFCVRPWCTCHRTNPEKKTHNALVKPSVTGVNRRKRSSKESVSSIIGRTMESLCKILLTANTCNAFLNSDRNTNFVTEESSRTDPTIYLAIVPNDVQEFTLLPISFLFSLGLVWRYRVSWRRLSEQLRRSRLVRLLDRRTHTRPACHRRAAYIRQQSDKQQHRILAESHRYQTDSPQWPLRLVSLQIRLREVALDRRIYPILHAGRPRPYSATVQA